MTFEPDAIDLSQEQLNELAKLLRTTNTDYIPLTGAEVMGLGLEGMTGKPKDLTNFEINLRGSFISGKINNQTKIISPSLVLSEPLQENNWFEYAETSAILNFIGNRLGMQSLLNKIQTTFAENFEYLSTGQAKSVIKRYLNLTLTSSERNDIYRLRKKMEGYQQLIDAFEDKLAVNRRRIDPYVDHDPRESLPSHDEFLQSAKDRLAFMCWECKTYVEFPEGDVITPPTHHDRVMSIHWNIKQPLESITASHRELEDAISDPNFLSSTKPKQKKKKKSMHEDFPKLYCEVCKSYQEIDKELEKKLLHSEHRITLPKHHNREMRILTTPVEFIEKFMKQADEIRLLKDNPEPGLYYLCKVCFLLIKYEDSDKDDKVEAPYHHDQEMIRIGVKS